MSTFEEKSIINVSEDKSRRRRKSPQTSAESDVNESFFSIVHEQSRLHDATTGKTVFHTPQQHTRSRFGTPSVYGTPAAQQSMYDADYRRHFRPGAASTPELYGDSDRYKHFAEGAVTTSSKKEESLIEWFDKCMESELAKRRPDSTFFDFQNRSPGIAHSLVIDATASGAEIQAGLRSEIDTDLLQAADRLAAAEAMVSFEGAVRAAELAAASAPPELAEEAAVKGARGFQAELTSCVRQNISGVKPIEVLGYVGITRPTVVKKP